MNALTREPARSRPVAVPPLHRAATYIRENHFDRPTLVIDLDMVAQSYRELNAGLKGAHIHYAVKANPHPQVISELVSMGSGFDAASRGEIELCLAQGATPDRISFGNTIKKPGDIAYAFEAGVRLFAADAEEELEKIAQNAPGAKVYIRLRVTASQADWPLSRKFGCRGDKAIELLGVARRLGLEPAGFSFHVGSQTREAQMWKPALDEIAVIWREAQEMGHGLSLLNIGGGFPAYYGQDIQSPREYAAEVMSLVHARFPDAAQVMAEPGRGMVAQAGAIAAEVLLVSRKSNDDLLRWVFLDIGKFSGLAETMDEAIVYQFEIPRDGEATGPCILAGPSCDSADVLYEKRPVHLPLGLRAGDKVIIHACGAYTTSYSSVGFNGFPPLDVRVI